MTGKYLRAALAAALSLPSEALACGGFFCNLNRPVDQAAEEILFAVDEDAGTVTMHVSIQYQGPAEEFAWVVPVPGAPELAIGTDALFPLLSNLRAQFVLDRELDRCAVPPQAASSSSSDVDNDGPGGVEVVSAGVVGPYETVVVKAEDSAELVGWLETHGFDLPSGLEPLLSPYVAEGQNFVALRLAKDKDAGDLEPLALTWRGQGLAIPIQLTSVAATPDMGLRVYVLGEERAVPDSYLHVVLNELAIDWWSGGGNLESVITRAADEAGGHGFFTDYSGPTDPVRGGLYSPSWEPAVGELAEAADAEGALRVVLGYGLPLDDALMGVLSDHLGLPDTSVQGLDLLDVLNCLAPYGYYYGGYSGCYTEELGAIVLDPASLAADVEREFLEPRRRTEALLAAHPKITRLTSSVSPAEMTVDPTFVFNPSMPDVPLQRSATETFLCSSTEQDLSSAPRELLLADGRRVKLPSIADLAALGLTEIQWLEDHALTEPVTARIERTGRTGDPEVLTDNTDYLLSQLEELEPEPAEARGCGCAPVGGPVPAGIAGAIAALAVGRRRRIRA